MGAAEHPFRRRHCAPAWAVSAYFLRRRVSATKPAKASAVSESALGSGTTWPPVNWARTVSKAGALNVFEKLARLPPSVEVKCNDVKPAMSAKPTTAGGCGCRPLELPSQAMPSTPSAATAAGKCSSHSRIAARSRSLTQAISPATNGCNRTTPTPRGHRATAGPGAEVERRRPVTGDPGRGCGQLDRHDAGPTGAAAVKFTACRPSGTGHWAPSSR